MNKTQQRDKSCSRVACFDDNLENSVREKINLYATRLNL